MPGRVLLMSHGLTSVTGFGNQHWVLARALADAGWDVYSCHKDYKGEVIKFAPGSTTENGKDLSNITMLPWGAQPWLEDKFEYYVQKYKPDIVYTLGDIWCYQFVGEMPNRKYLWLANYEFDTENVVGFWHQNVAAADMSIVPSKFAYEMLRDAGHKNVVYVPHCVDTKIFKPVTYEEKTALRKRLSFSPDDFIISCVAHNQQRKMLARLIRAFAIFAADKPNVKLFMHTQIKDYSGWDMPQIVSDLRLNDKVLFTDKNAKMTGDVHVSPQMMREYYCISDVHANASGGEGFGIPIVEAMACGIPNVAVAYTTPKEFLCELTVTPKGERMLENVRGIAVPYVDIEWHHTGGVWALVDCEKMASAFQALYDNTTLRHQYGTKARSFVIDNYDEVLIKSKWVELFDKAPDFVRELKAEANDKPDYIKAVKIGVRPG